jgi:hypothetical protein
MRTLYEKPSNLQREDSLFQTFLRLEPDQPGGTWTKTEAPDYVLAAGDVTIGLELTSLVDSELAAVRGAQHRVLERAQQIATSSGITPLDVKVKFSSDRAQVPPEEAAIELFTIVKGCLPNLDDTQIHHLSGFHSKYFSMLTVRLGSNGGKQWLDHHRWHHLHMNWVRRDPIQQIQQAIDDKSKKLEAYLTKCNECWLLIGVDEWTAPEAVALTDQGLEYQFSSRFARTYFLRNIEGSLVRLFTG